jgi:hypothetical protein
MKYVTCNICDSHNFTIYYCIGVLIYAPTCIWLFGVNYSLVQQKHNNMVFVIIPDRECYRRLWAQCTLYQTVLRKIVNTVHIVSNSVIEDCDHSAHCIKQSVMEDCEHSAHCMKQSVMEDCEHSAHCIKQSVMEDCDHSAHCIKQSVMKDCEHSAHCMKQSVTEDCEHSECVCKFICPLVYLTTISQIHRLHNV